MTLKATRVLIGVFIVLVSLRGFAEVIQFAPDELAAETVVPLLDTGVAVKNRLVPYKGRFEAEFVASSMIDEMFFNNTLLGVQLLYHINDVQGVGLRYLSHMSGTSSYADQFKETPQQVDLSKAPSPKSILTAAYRWSFLYGKVSMTKNHVLPTVFSLEAEAGVNKVGSQMLPLTSLGMTQKVFFMRHLGVGFSYRLFLYQTVDPVSTAIGSTAPNPKESDFDKKLQISQGIDLSFSYLF